ncbi:AAA family ATPase [Leucobacter viscericola]|uniref:AAA family ATPase n=1 Tax=Leucobacter viscericola TaxID=2714935 RepID=A0A6G7XEP9_9MICO|nr:helix-turn-helix transcriptional regulator [Leucobacter viscericola]QIK62848.1 AAA family ATPase [Leucobacter viscericola]
MSHHEVEPAMVGRDAELAHLRDRFRGVLRGQGAATLITGEAGIGKSRLVRDLADAARDEADVLIGRCIDLKQAATPYGPLLEVLRTLVTARGADSLLESPALDHSSRSAFLLLLPELVDAETPDGASGSPPFPSEDHSGPERLREAITTVLRIAAKTRPLILVIEDLHWADEGTLAVLTTLLQSITETRILAVLTMKNDGRRSNPARRFAAESERTRVLEQLPLARLGDEEVRAMVNGLMQHPLAPQTFSQLLERSEGVPFFVEELVENAAAPLTDSLRDVLLARYDRLGREAASLVRAMSTSQSPLPHATLVRLVSLPEEELESALRETIDAGVIAVNESDNYVFRHALLREAVQGELLPGERTRLNRALAEILQQIADSDTKTAPLSELAYHWDQAKDPEKSFIAAFAAMRQAESKYAYAAAVRFGEHVLENWDESLAAAEEAGINRLKFLERFASILRNAGQTERGLTVVDLALDEVEGLNDPVAKASLLQQKAYYLSHLGRPGREPLILQALAALDSDPRFEIDLGVVRLKAKLLSLLTSTLMHLGKLTEAVAAATEAARYAEQCADKALLSITYSVRGSCLAGLGQVETGLTDLLRARPLAVNGSSLMKFHTNYSDLLNILGRYHEAVEVAEEGLVVSRRYGVERSTGAILMQNLVEPLLELGEIERVEQLLQLGIDSHAVRIQQVYTLVSRVRALCWRGRAEEAEELYRDWAEPLHQTAELERQVWYAQLLMEVTLATTRDDFEQARLVILRMLQDERPQSGNQRRLLLEGGWIAAECRSRGHEVSTFASRVLSRWESQPQEMQDPYCSSVLRGLLNPSADLLDAALSASNAESVPRIFQVIVRIELSRLLLASGERTRAAAVALEAQDLCIELAHETLGQHVKKLVQGIGTGRTTSADGSPDSLLTPREQQVLDLVAEGLSNRQIGERLFISAKTVSVHVSAVLRKLGVSSRTQAARSELVSEVRVN